MKIKNCFYKRECVCLTLSSFVYSFRKHVMSVAVGTKRSLKGNETKKAEKPQKGDILENSVTVCHNVVYLQFCHLCGKGAGASADK